MAGIETIGPIVADITNLADALTGGVLSEFGVVLRGIETGVEDDRRGGSPHLADIFGTSTHACRRVTSEKLFLWSDMSHYRRPSALCQCVRRQEADASGL